VSVLEVVHCGRNYEDRNTIMLVETVKQTTNTGNVVCTDIQEKRNKAG
jgi:hypothetical protein